jgi:hypothetical protein
MTEGSSHMTAALNRDEAAGLGEAQTLTTWGVTVNAASRS